MNASRLFGQVAGKLSSASRTAPRWSRARANAWYDCQPWLIGANYVTSDAINQFEMFQADTFNPSLIDRELALAEDLGMNTMRVFLQDQLWERDAPGLLARFDIFLEIAASRGIRTMPVLFDSCWDPHPKPGKQPAPTPGIHNSGWVQSPGARRLAEPAFEPALQAYVQGVVGAFAQDDRIVAWDIWNEPCNDNVASYSGRELKGKTQRVATLLPKAFAWARALRPEQPLTSGVWTGDWTDPTKQSEMVKIQLAESDILTFHDYDWANGFKGRVEQLLPHGRPIVCTEYMARGIGSTFEKTLPFAREHRIGALNWGFVAGKTQTHLPWNSWQTPYVHTEPPVWFHEIFRHDAQPYCQHEVDLIRQLTGRYAPRPAHTFEPEFAFA